MPNVPVTKIPVARNIATAFNNATNCEKKNTKKAAGNPTKKIVYTSTPRSSKSSAIKSQAIHGRNLMAPIVEKRTTTFSSIQINYFNFSTGSSEPVVVVEPAAAPVMLPFEFIGSDHQSSHSPLKEKMSKCPPSIGKRDSRKSTSNVKQDSAAETVRISDKRLERQERHQSMFKSRYARKNRNNDGKAGGIRMNRRFDLLMKFREDRMDADRLVL